MAEFLYILKPVRLEMVTESPSAQEAKVLAAHFAYLQDLHRKGQTYLVGRTQNNNADTIGLVVFEAPDETAARSIMKNDPAVKENVMSATLYPYKVALMRGR